MSQRSLKSCCHGLLRVADQAPSRSSMSLTSRRLHTKSGAEGSMARGWRGLRVAAFTIPVSYGAMCVWHGGRGFMVSDVSFCLNFGAFGGVAVRRWLHAKWSRLPALHQAIDSTDMR